MHGLLARGIPSFWKYLAIHKFEFHLRPGTANPSQDCNHIPKRLAEHMRGQTLQQSDHLSISQCMLVYKSAPVPNFHNVTSSIQVATFQGAWLNEVEPRYWNELTNIHNKMIKGTTMWPQVWKSSNSDAEIILILLVTSVTWPLLRILKQYSALPFCNHAACMYE